MLVTDELARDEKGRSVRELFAKDPRVASARVRLAGEVLVPGGTPWTSRAELFSAGIDSLAPQVNGIVVDLLDYGSRSGTAPRALLVVLRAAASKSVPVFILDRPNPVTGEHIEGPVLDSAAAASDGVYGLPQRHGMTVGEMAQYFNAAGKIGATLTVVPVRGWRRSQWPSERGLQLPGQPRKPGSLILANAFELCAATNLTCDGGGVSAPWLTPQLVSALKDRLMPGVDFNGLTGLSGGGMRHLRVEIENPDQATGSRIMAAILSELVRLYPRQLVIDRARMAELSGSDSFAGAILAGEDSDTAVDRTLPVLAAFKRRAKDAYIYR